MPPRGHSAIDRLWYGEGLGASVARAALAPASLLYGVVTGIRNALYDRGAFRARPVALPAIGVGNLSVGGTGKTPVAAWLAGELLARGARPAVVLRGYGDDEPLVHARLTPAAVIVASPDRVAAVADAARRGADVAVLDDAFQHRRASRDVDVVLVSADAWPGGVRLLPAGPFREGLGSLGRAQLVVITRKAASPADAERVARAIAVAAPGTPQARVHLSPTALVNAVTNDVVPLTVLRDAPVVAACGIGAPHAFAAQLAAVGARVELHAFPDHHAFGDADIAELARAATRLGGQGRVVCTLKDAVKLASRWPEGAPALWYVSQQVILEAGRDVLDPLLDSVLHARSTAANAAR